MKMKRVTRLCASIVLRSAFWASCTCEDGAVLCLQSLSRALARCTFPSTSPWPSGPQTLQMMYFSQPQTWPLLMESASLSPTSKLWALARRLWASFLRLSVSTTGRSCAVCCDRLGRGDERVYILAVSFPGLIKAWDKPKKRATCLCHGICFIEDEQLEWRAGIPGHRLTHRGGSKGLDLFPHHIDASLITRIELLHPRLRQLGPTSVIMASRCRVNSALRMTGRGNLKICTASL